MESTVSTPVPATALFETEEHLAETNRFFQLSQLTLDDLHAWGSPLGMACLKIRMAADGLITRQEALDAVAAAIDQIQAMEDHELAANEG